MGSSPTVLQCRRGRSVLEMALLLIAVSAALIAMQIYVKRGVSGRLRLAAEALGDPYIPGRTSATEVTRFHLKRHDAVVELGTGPTASRVLLTSSTADNTTARHLDETVTDDSRANVFSK